MKGTILLVDDAPTFRQMYRSILEGSGFRVVDADDGEKGWALVQSEKPSLVLLDLVLPKLAGPEVLKRIRQNAATKDIPVIIYSLLGERVDIQKGLDLGANDYLVKGFHSPREVVRKIEEALANAARVASLVTYRVIPIEGREDASKLMQAVGLTKGFACPTCGAAMSLELIPDFARADGHWFSARFACAPCKKTF